MIFVVLLIRHELWMATDTFTFLFFVIKSHSQPWQWEKKENQSTNGGHFMKIINLIFSVSALGILLGSPENEMRLIKMGQRDQLLGNACQLQQQYLVLYDFQKVFSTSPSAQVAVSDRAESFHPPPVPPSLVF